MPISHLGIILLAPEPGIEPGATGLEAVVLPLHHPGIVIGAPGEIRTHTVLDLNQSPPANWATGANILVLEVRFELTKA